MGRRGRGRAGPRFRLGTPAFVAHEHAAFATGLARHALDLLTGIAITKKRGYGPDAKTLADRETLQRFIGHSELKLRSARTLAMDLNAQAMAAIECGDALEVHLAIELRGIAVYCTEVATEIVGAAFRFAGASSIYESSDMQRCLRDINVAGQHLFVSDKTYELLGRTHLGFSDVQAMG